MENNLIKRIENISMSNHGVLFAITYEALSATDTPLSYAYVIRRGLCATVCGYFYTHEEALRYAFTLEPQHSELTASFNR